MEKYTKILWKIASLWEQYSVHSEESSLYTIPYQDYPDGISRYHGDFRRVKKINFEESGSPVFSDEYGSYYGLKYNQVLNVGDKVVYVFDNHNKILFPLTEYYETTSCNAIHVLHIDAHPDDAIFRGSDRISELTRSNCANVISRTRVSDFFDAISETKLVSNIQRVVTSQDFHTFNVPHLPYVLSLDIDIFGTEGNFVDLETKVSVIAQAWKYADVIMIATSPGFINQEFAYNIIYQLTKKQKKLTQ
jgi:hypothetical protein